MLQIFLQVLTIEETMREQIVTIFLLIDTILD